MENPFWRTLDILKKICYNIYEEKKRRQNMSYNFNMRDMLNAFGGDAEQLANAFAESLNNELASKRTRELIEENAERVAKTWNSFVYIYFEAYPAETKGLNEEDYYMAPTLAVDLLEGLMREPQKTKQNTVAAPQARTFSNSMDKFFKENNI